MLLECMLIPIDSRSAPMSAKGLATGHETTTTTAVSSTRLEVPIRISIVSLYDICIKGFDSLSTLLFNEQQPEAEAEKQLLSAHIANVQKEFGRFKLWAGNYGAHRTARSRLSLDYRLREASHVHDMVTKLLEGLGEALEAAITAIRMGKIYNSEPVTDVITLPEALSSAESDSDSDSSLILAELEEEATMAAELQCALDDITHFISCLYRFSLVLRQPALRDRLQKCARIDVSWYQYWDTQHVMNKFPAAEKYLCERLGKANTKRRQLFEYHRQHHDKIARYIDASPTDDRTSKNVDSEPPSQTKMEGEHQVSATPLPVPAATTSYGGTQTQTGTSVTTFKQLPEIGHQESDDGQSQTSYSTSLRSQSNHKLRVPPIPADALHGPFICPYCYDTITAKSTKVWMKHVFEDLHPYVCTFKDCAKPDELFVSRRDWYQHEMQFHRREWRCVSSNCEQSTSFSSKLGLIEHLKQRHMDTVHEADMSAVADRCEMGMFSEQECPLCETKHIPAKLQSHLGHHMEQLSLFILPRNQEKDEDTDCEMSDRTQLELNVGELSGWETPPYQHVHTFSEHTDSVFGVAFSPDGQLVASASRDKTVRLWSVPHQQHVHTFSGHTDRVLRIAFSPDSQMVASASSDMTVQLWSVPQRQHLHTIRHTGSVWGIAFSPDGQLVASASDDNTVRLWSVPHQQHVHTFSGHSDWVRGVGFSPDGQLVASVSDDKTVQLWSVPYRQHTHTFSGHTNFVYSVAFSPDGQLVASASWDNTVRLWSVPHQRHVHTFSGHTSSVQSVAFSPDGQLVASASDDDTVRLWSVPYQQYVHTFSGHTDGVLGVAFSPDGQLVLSGSRDNTVRLWSTKFLYV